MDEPSPPQRIQTRQMLMRPWHPTDAPLLQSALEASRTELRQWTPWVLEGHDELDALEGRLAGYRSDFALGKDWLYALMDPLGSSVWGGAGLYQRVGAGALEIGYWIRSDVTGRGLATEATQALIAVAFGLPEVARVEIHCSEENRASNRIPEKLGFRHRETLRGKAWAPVGTEAALLIWERTRPEVAGPPAASATEPTREE